MKNIRYSLWIVVLLVFSSIPSRAADNDPFLWLEEVESPKAMDWVKAQNEKSLGVLTKDPRYPKMEAQIREILLAKDRLPVPSLRNGWIYNFWQDADHVRGIWRRARPDEYAKKDPAWEMLLDVDRLNADEKQDWVWEGPQCLPPAYEDCLIQLSHGGKDAVVVREFDVSKKAFVQDGFGLPEAKTDVSWVDSNHILVGTDFGPGTLTRSGYPRIVKQWSRGTPIAQAKTVLEAEETDVVGMGRTYFRPDGNVSVIEKYKTFYESKRWILRPDETLKVIPFPDDADLQGVFRGELLAVLRTDWKISKSTFPAGALVALPVKAISDAKPEEAVELVYAPDTRSSISGISTTKNHLYIDMLQNVRGHIFQASRSSSGWNLERLPLPDLGVAHVAAADPFEDLVLAKYESFLMPTTLYSFDGAKSGASMIPIKQLPTRFDAGRLAVEQLQTSSADGTKIPYFLVHPKDMKLDGTHPTLLYGYGGFEHSMDPYYLGDTGKVWSESGGVFVLANIRGGGEFGPKWHEAALKEHRQRAFDDFIAVAQDIVSRKVTSSGRLGIMGGSNGGLLVGAVLVQKPELFHAVVCQVPLLDMLRYTKISAGSSWIAEYGDPEDPQMAKAIRAYSPYQNVRSGAKYPQVLFLTSTKDDRVNPAHARKMAARMLEQGHDVLYFENIEGGHGAAADLEERVKLRSLQFTYLFQRLVD